MDEADKRKLTAEILTKVDRMVFERYDQLDRPERSLAGMPEQIGTVMLSDIPKSGMFKGDSEVLIQAALHIQKLRVDLVMETKGVFPMVGRDVAAVWPNSYAPGHLSIAMEGGKRLLDEAVSFFKKVGVDLRLRIAICCGAISFHPFERGITLLGNARDGADALLASDLPVRSQLLVPEDIVIQKERRQGMTLLGRTSLKCGTEVNVLEYRPGTVVS